ncbi:MAG: hypothetical protein Q8P38_12545 [Candidatus Nanopelagicales bacterium]|nr:hypothetical protein [Candidatus Nanopelagicales bacterium]
MKNISLLSRLMLSAVVVGVTALPVGGIAVPASADPGQCVAWNGNVTGIIANANARVAKLSQSTLRRWFDVPDGSGKARITKAFVNAFPTVAKPTAGEQLGKVQVVYNVYWQRRQGADYAIALKYLDGCRNGIKKIDSMTIGSFGFPNKPKTDLKAAVRLTKQYRKANPGVIPSGYQLEMAQLQRADAPPPWWREKRWVVSFRRAGYQLIQLLVTMDGDVEPA